MSNKISNLKNKVVNATAVIWSQLAYKIIVFIILALYISNTLGDFNKDTKKRLNTYTRTYINSIVDDSVDKVQLSVNDEYKMLSNLALSYDFSDEGNIESTKQFLEKSLTINNFIGLVLINDDGEIIEAVGENQEWDYTTLLSTTSKGGYFTSSSYKSDDNNSYICFAVPMYNEEKTDGALVATYDLEKFTEILDTSSFGKMGTIFITQTNGNIIAGNLSAKGTNIFDVMSSVDSATAKKLKKALKNNQSGTIKYETKSGSIRYVSYSTIPATGWYCVSMVSEKTISKLPNNIRNNAVKTFKKINTSIAIVIVLVLVMDLRIIYLNHKDKHKKIDSDK